MKLLIIGAFLIGLYPLQAGYGNTYIRHIDIIRQNVFDNQQSDNFIYRLGDKFHVVTRENVIKRELLFEPGDQFSEELLNQSVRNIRALPFIGEVITYVKQADADSVDIIITTEDLWTTILGASSEGGGGLYSLNFYADEKNIAGFGIGIETDLSFTSDDNDGYAIHLFDSRFLSTRNYLDLNISDYTYSSEFAISVTRPYYTVDTRWGYSGQYSKQRQWPRVFDQGEKVFQYKHDYDYLMLTGSRAFGRYSRLQTNLQYFYNELDYTELPDYPDSGIIPDDEIISGPGLGFKLTTFKYTTGRYLDEFGTTEDLTEHVTLSGGALWSGPTFGANYAATLLSLDFGFFFQPAGCLYTGFKNSYSHYYVDNFRRERIANVMETILYLKPSIYHLFSFRSVTSFAWRQKSNYRLTLGGDNGLRGYPDRYFNGTRLALMNAEYKVYTPLEILTVGLGGVVFFDAGYVWDKDDNIRLSDVKSDLGLGLRFGLTKSSTARSIRFDLAKSLADHNWYISFGTENMFSLASFQ
jgi:outer membrane protein assembly factor BamA